MRKKLLDLCDFYSGTGFPMKYQGKIQDELPFYKVGDIANNVVRGNVYLKMCKNYISETEAKEIKGTIIPPNTVVFAKIGEALRLNRRAITTTRCLIDNNVMGIAPLESEISLKYFYYFMCNLKMESFAESTTVPSVRKSKLEEVEIDLPNMQEQHNIEKILDEIVTLMQLSKIQLEQYDILIKSRFVEMFGDPVDNPKRWEKRQLQEIVTDDCTISYGIVQAGDDKEEGISIFRPVDIVNRMPKLEELKKTTVEISNKYKKTLLRGREMLITVRANIADTCIIGEEFKGCNVGRGIVPIRVQEDIILLEFLKSQLDNKHLNDNIKALAKGIALIQLNMEDLRIVELIIPPIEKQKIFVDFTKKVDKLKVEEQQRLEKAQILFDSLMQQYFG